MPVKLPHLVFQDLVVVRQPRFADPVDRVLVDVLKLQLQFQQLQEVVLVIRLVDALHEAGLAVPLLRIGFTVGVQGAGELAIDLADGQADLRLFVCLLCFCRKLLRRFLPRGPAGFTLGCGGGLFLGLLRQVRTGALQQCFLRVHVRVIAEADAEGGLQPCLHLRGLHRGFPVEVRAAVLVVERLQASVFINQVTRKIDDERGYLAALGLGEGIVLIDLVQAAHKADLQCDAAALQRQELAGISALELNGDRLPIRQPLAPILDLLDQRVECSLAF
ncbi:hypothetical protein [Ralstonia sp. GP71]|uniref:hypothetical protein n=1 Tax=Ralstonia sp. GP71 TaxID=3035152 RepID=UPI003891DDAA